MSTDTLTLDLENLPDIDLVEGLKLAGNKRDLAKDLLAQFIAHLPVARNKINHLYTQKNLNELLNEVHKLHGACCYCGVPRLKHVVATLETELNKQDSDIDELMALFNEEVEELIDTYTTATYLSS